MLPLNLTRISSVFLILAIHVMYASAGQAAQCKQIGNGGKYYFWYSNTSTEKGKKECSMGRHTFCALSTVQMSDVRGWCYVGRNMGDWKLVTVNDRNVPLSQTCGAICIDKMPNTVDIGMGRDNEVPGKDNGYAILGQWLWVDGQQLRIYRDKTLAVFKNGKKINQGTWEYVDAVKRQYVFHHQKGGWIDTVTLSDDGRVLDGRNNHGFRLHGERM